MNGKSVVGLTHIDHVVDATDTMHFFYDAQGRTTQVKFNDAMYNYIHNIHGNIIGVLDSHGKLVVEYKYDAWGSMIATEGSMAITLGNQNPFRYREYIYDDEIRLYRLEGRCYSPERRRFINADADIRGDLYEYCRNNPVNRVDFSGERSIELMRGKTAIHNKVATMVALEVNGVVERVLTSTKGAGRHGGYGYPDVIVVSSNLV